ncbi:MAG: glycosyltransferase [Candidatus Obscuribacterales bacterium]|nr:glycosyltransferase [Candidatus Obscuribacterales bacterium]
MFDPAKWAVVGHKDDSGLGRQMSDVQSVLNVGYYLAVPSERLFDHPLTGSGERLLDPGFSDDQVREALSGLQGIIFPERHAWHNSLLKIAKELNVKTVCIPNWEWFRGTDVEWQLCDLFVCQSHFTMKVVASYGWKKLVYIPIAIDIGRFPGRLVEGKARLFVHNAGLVDQQDRKGTRDTILAFKKVKREDIRLFVRMQKETDLPSLDSRIEIQVGNLTDPAELYATGDVAVQPSKMEGNGFMVLEPLVTGMPVITTDYPPMNEYVTTKELLVRKKWFKRRAFPTQWVKHAHLRLPDINDLAAKINWCADNDLTRISQENRTSSELIFSRDSLRGQWYAALEGLCK